MDPFTVISAVADIFTAVGVAVAGGGLLLNWKVRVEDLRWRKANAAHQALTDIHKSPYALEAIHMIDCVRWQHRYVPSEADAGFAHLDPEEIESVINPDTPIKTEDQRKKHEYAHRCFDWLLYYMDRVAYQTKAGLLADDFATPLAPYAHFVQSCSASEH